MIKDEDYIFEIPRIGKYQLLKHPTRDFSVGTYIDKAGKIWFIERI